MTTSKLAAGPQAQRLLALLARLSYRRGITTLASGRTSDFYIDCKQTALHSEGAALIGALVYAHVQALRAAGHVVDAVGGLSLGADPLAVACAVTSACQAAPVHAFIIRKQPKQHGTSAWLEGSANVPAGSSVLVLEDVVTTGASTEKAVLRARDSGLCPVAILALVDREEGGRENLQALGLPYASLFTRADFLGRADTAADVAS